MQNEGGQAAGRAVSQARPAFLPGHQPQPEGDRLPGTETKQQGPGPGQRGLLVNPPPPMQVPHPWPGPGVFRCQEVQAHLAAPATLTAGSCSPAPSRTCSGEVGGGYLWPLGTLLWAQAQGRFRWPVSGLLKEAVYVAKAGGGISALGRCSSAEEVKSSCPVLGSSAELLGVPRSRPQPLPPSPLGAACWPEWQLAGRRRCGPGPASPALETAGHEVRPTGSNRDHQWAGRGFLKGAPPCHREGAAPWKTTLSCE